MVSVPRQPARSTLRRQRRLGGFSHRRRFALVDGDDLLASADCYDFTGLLDQQPVTICGISPVFCHAPDVSNNHAGALLEWLLEDSMRDGADIALFFQPSNTSCPVSESSEVVPMIEVEVTVAESSRHGAPMTLVRAGEDRDLGAIAAMGQVRSRQFRFHIDRGVDLIKHAIVRNRLLAGLAEPGARQQLFVIAEEGITAAAYIVLSVIGTAWTIEECGDRDSSGARVGALLQALIAREPVELRPVIRGWLPKDFVPPQVTIVSASPSTELVVARTSSPRVSRLKLSSRDVLYWHNDVF